VSAGQASAPELRVLALGDSYTIGEDVLPHERWPVRLAALLRGRGLSIAEPRIIARTGWTTDELSRGIDDDPPTGEYDLVTLLIGVNDQYRGRPADDYRERFRALLQRAIGFASQKKPSRVIVLSIPDWGVTPFAADLDRSTIAEEIDRYNAINSELTAQSGAHYVDVTPISRGAAGDNLLLASDGLHPSGAMYEDWARLVSPVAERALDSR
jgi:lysophospholipase L1-like esterase